MKKIFIILILVITACSEDVKTNLELKNHINSITEKTIIYEYEVDSLGKTIDTLSIEKNKKNKNEVIVFSDKLVFTGTGYLQSEKYFRDNENLFYSKSQSSEIGILSTLEFWEKNTEIIKGLNLSYRDGKIKDTMNINYQYLYNDNGLKQKTIITNKYANEDKIGAKTELNYNELGEILSEVSILYKDTLYVSKYFYSEELLKKKTIEDYKKDIIINFHYNEKGYVSKRETYSQQLDTILKISKTKYKTNDKGQLLNSVQTRFPDANKTYLVYKYENKE